MAPLLNEAVAANAAGHITDHDLIAHVINTRNQAVAAAPANGATYAPDTNAGTVHVLTLPAGGNVTIGAATSSAAAAMPKYLPAGEMTLVLIQPAGTGCTVGWDASWLNAPAVAPVPGRVQVCRFINTRTADTTAAAWQAMAAQNPIVCTSATRPPAAQLYPGLVVVETDTGQVRVWSGSYWTASSPLVVTSTTRPATGLYPGLTIFETDTGVTRTWTGAAWSGDTAWTALPLSNSWVAYGAPFAAPQYRRLASGMVVVEGVAKNGTLTSGITVATLPAGYRPGAQIITVQNSNNAFARLDVHADGTIVAGAAIPSAAFLSLHATFLAEA